MGKYIYTRRLKVGAPLVSLPIHSLSGSHAGGPAGTLLCLATAFVFLHYHQVIKIDLGWVLGGAWSSPY
jgi:hypothetical protein